jgi:hypothetical protein
LNQGTKVTHRMMVSAGGTRREAIGKFRRRNSVITAASWFPQTTDWITAYKAIKVKPFPQL